MDDDEGDEILLTESMNELQARQATACLQILISCTNVIYSAVLSNPIQQRSSSVTVSGAAATGFRSTVGIIM